MLISVFVKGDKTEWQFKLRTAKTGPTNRGFCP